MNPKKEVRTISKGAVIICRISKVFYSSSGYLNPLIKLVDLDFSFYLILIKLGSFEVTFLISFCIKILEIFVDLALINICLNFFYLTVYEDDDEDDEVSDPS
jgi:hypothetical protein